MSCLLCEEDKGQDKGRGHWEWLLLAWLSVHLQQPDFHRAESWGRTEASLEYTRENPQQHCTFRVRSKIPVICCFPPEQLGCLEKVAQVHNNISQVYPPSSELPQPETVSAAQEPRVEFVLPLICVIMV